jgi:hypothetical protein
MDDTVSMLSANTTARIPTPIGMTRKLAAVYQVNDADYRQRYEKIGKRFKDYYQCDVQFMVRVPAVVKVPVEQSDLRLLDYGMACLEQDVVVAIAKSESRVDQIEIGNTEKAKFPLVGLVLVIVDLSKGWCYGV